MKKKKVWSLIGLFMLACAVSGMTYAYLIDADYGHNKVKTGTVEAEIEETYDPPEKLEPGISFSKEPWVKNTGNSPCYVRLQALFSDSRAEEFSTLEELNTTEWTDGEDGYYYYTELLEPGKRTPSLFTGVTIGSVDPSELVEFEILLYAEAVQPGPGIVDYQEAWESYGQ